MSTVASPRRLSRDRWVAATLALAVAGSLASVPTPAGAAAGAPDLVVKRATVDRGRVAEGAALQISHVVTNAGGSKAGATETRFYLTRDVAASSATRKASRTNPRSAPQDVRLLGASRVKQLAGGRSATTAPVEVTVPVGTAAGVYSVLACADDRGSVTEKNEANNCTVAVDRLTVKAAEDTGSLVLQQFADSERWPANEDFNVQMMKAFCNLVTPAKALSLTKAVGNVEAFIDAMVGAEPLDDLERSPLADTATEAQELAATGIAGDSPGLALASLMRAHGLEPRNGTHLVNLAAVATSVGLPNEALAFLDAAQSRDFRRPAMGVSQHAIALTVRGQALVMTGQPAKGEAMFRAAKAAEPMLSEADAGLATVAACEDEKLIAARHVRKSRQRSQAKDETEPTEEVRRPAPQLDLGWGKVTTMRNFPIAETPAQGVVMRPVYWDIRASTNAEGAAIRAEEEQLEQHLEDTDELRTQAEIARRDSILMLVGGAGLEPDLKALRDLTFDKADELQEMEIEFWGAGTANGESTYGDLQDAAFEACRHSDDPDCVDLELNATCRPALSAAHTQWRALMSEYETLLKEYVAATSKRMSGYASNLQDEEAHRLAMLDIESMESTYYSALLSPALGWTHGEVLRQDACVEPMEAQPMEQEEPEPAQSSGPCPKGIAAMNFVAVLGPSKIKVSCEKVTQELSLDVAPMLKAFGEISYDFRTGKVTVFAGSKGEASTGVVKAGFKSGIYLTSDSRGGIEDVGWRVQPSVSAVEGAMEFQAYKDTVDLSFVGALKIGP